MVVIFTLPLLVACSASDSHLSNHEPERLRQVRQIASEMPIPPSFHKVGSNEGAKDINAIVTDYYQSSASYEEVRQFYTAALAQKGWQLSGEESLRDWFRDKGGKKLIFRKEAFTIAVQYDPDASANYAVSYVWKEG
jgi:hypothetical protein